jgi:hypothetical protein
MEQTTLGLKEIWKRLDPLCRRLWDENSPVAVGLQALSEEFNGEVQRAAHLLQACQETIKEQQKSIAEERGRVEALRKDLLAREAENAEFHDRFLKLEATHDEERSKKMEAFYQDLNKKRAELESSLEARRWALEDDHNQRAQALQKKHDELVAGLKQRGSELELQHTNQEADLAKTHARMLQDMSTWEAETRRRDEALLNAEKAIVERERQIKEEYQKKQLEFQQLKESLRAEVTELIKQYQLKLRDDAQKQPSGH